VHAILPVKGEEGDGKGQPRWADFLVQWPCIPASLMPTNCAAASVTFVSLCTCVSLLPLKSSKIPSGMGSPVSCWIPGLLWSRTKASKVLSQAEGPAFGCALRRPREIWASAALKCGTRRQFEACVCGCPGAAQGGHFELGDRVVSLLKEGVPPFGYHGTVIGESMGWAW